MPEIVIIRALVRLQPPQYLDYLRICKWSADGISNGVFTSFVVSLMLDYFGEHHTRLLSLLRCVFLLSASDSLLNHRNQLCYAVASVCNVIDYTG